MDDFKTPNLATGKFVPESVWLAEMKEEKEKELRKQQRRHDWFIALFGVFGGAVTGFLSSLVFWLITN